MELEVLAERILDEANELASYFEGASLCANDRKQLNNSISNFRTYSDAVYNVFENNDIQEIKDANDKLDKENKLLLGILKDKLSETDKLYYRIKYGIQID